jgi:hypothetical protein
MAKRSDGRVPRRRVTGIVLGLIALLPLLSVSRPVSAEEILSLAAGQSAIVFMVTGQGLSGDIQIRERQGAPVWDALISQTTVRQFTVQPGTYTLVLAPGKAPIPLAAQAGRATLVSLAGAPADGGYRIITKSEVSIGEVAHTALPSFIGDNRIAPLDYAPIALDKRGSGLTFLVRADF